MDHYQNIPLLTAMHWDCDGELCSDDLGQLLGMLTMQEVDARGQELAAHRKLWPVN
jgi:hypothetical protein